MKNVTIHRVMTPAPATLTPTATVLEAERLMRERRCHHLPVVEGRDVVGMLSTHELIKALVLRPEARETDAEILRRAPLGGARVADVMRRNVRVLTETATLLDVARALGAGSFHALPVVAADGRLVGIVTSTDVIQALAEELERAPGTNDERAAPARPIAGDVTDPQVHALRDVYRAARNFLASGQAEAEHTRLVQATDRARDALRAAGVEIGR